MSIVKLWNGCGLDLGPSTFDYSTVFTNGSHDVIENTTGIVLSESKLEHRFDS